MGSSSSKEQLMANAIENQDIEAVRTLIKDLTNEQKRILCQTLVPGDENQCTIFHYATWQDNPELLTLLIDYIDDIEMHDGLQWTPLMTAVNRGSKENVKVLLKHGAKIDCDSNNGTDLIASAMAFHDAELIEILIDHGAQANPPDENSQQCHLLHFAADDNLIDIARVLIEKGKIPINKLDQSGWSALHIAAGHNFLEFVKLLLKYHADINIKDRDGNTPLAWAIETNAEDVIKELESQGAVADSEWHGEKYEYHEREGEEEDEEGNQELHGIDNAQFEIEESTNNLTPVSDALQRQ